jgi:hypothetical protein
MKTRGSFIMHFLFVVVSRVLLGKRKEVDVYI